MNLIIVLVLGAIIGWLGARLADRNERLLGSIVIGILGAFIGSFLASVLTGSSPGILALSWSSVVWALIGAVILSALLNGFQHEHHGSRI